MKDLKQHFTYGKVIAFILLIGSLINYKIYEIINGVTAYSEPPREIYQIITGITFFMAIMILLIQLVAFITQTWNKQIKL